MIGSVVDFDSNPITIIFGVGEVSKTVNVSVSCDEEVEGDEIFDIVLSLTSKYSQIKVGRSRSTGKITDSTGQ